MSPNRQRQIMRLAGLLALACWAGITCVQAASLTRLLVPPPAPAPGSTTTLTVYWLNETDATLDLVIPDLLVCDIGNAAGESATLEAVHAAEPAPAPRVLAPGTFRQTVYTLAVPARLQGPLTVRLHEPAAAPATTPVAATPPPAALGNRRLQPEAADRPAPALPAPAAEEIGAGSPPPDHLRLADPAADILHQFSPNEPMFFLYGPESPNIRYQVSFKYRVFQVPPDAAPETTEWWQSFYFGYAQTSLWNFSAPSSPFYDTSYKPSFFLQRENLQALSLPGVSRLDFQTGYQHESNGRDGDNSRSINMLYLKPTVYFGDPKAWHLTVAPRLWTYIADLSDNRDIADYRGHADLTTTFGRPDSLQFAVLLRAGDAFQHPTAQFDLTWPLARWFPSVSRSLYLQAQYFTGYGESIHDYSERTDSLRLGFAIWR